MKKIFILLSVLSVFLSCKDKDNADARIIDEEQNDVISDKISNHKILSFAEDQQGHVWIGTFRGLNKYDGQEYHQYFCTNDTMGLPDNQVRQVFKDSKNRLWILTVGGICLYTEKDKFQRITIPVQNTNLQKIVEDGKGRIFIDNYETLLLYDEKGEKFIEPIRNFNPKHLYIRTFIDRNNTLWITNPFGIQAYDATTFKLKRNVTTPIFHLYSFMQSNGYLWLAYNNDITVYDTKSNKFLPLPPSITSNKDLSKANVYYMYQYKRYLLFCTENHGMFCYDSVNGKVMHQNEQGFPFEAPDFFVTTMFTDSQQNLWIGSDGQGYVVRYHYKDRFNNNAFLTTSFKGKSVKSLTLDKHHRLWILTGYKEIYVYDFIRKDIKKMDLGNIYANYVYADENGDLWVTMFNGDVMRYAYDGTSLRLKRKYYMVMARFVVQDKFGTIWISTSGGSVYAMKKGEKDFTLQQINWKSYSFIPCLLPTNNGDILVMSHNNPIKMLNEQTFRVSDFPISKQDKDTCIRRSVYIPVDAMQDHAGNIWFGTITNGLLQYNQKTMRLKPISGTHCSDISSIEEDNHGNIWISTLFGLCRYNPMSKEMNNYFVSDGIGGNEFSERASVKLPDGNLVFGGSHGLTYFNPVDVNVKKNIPLMFEYLRVHNKLVMPGEGGCIDKQLSLRPDVHLKHNQNSFSISFAALDYCEYERVHYFYKMEGVNSDWVDAFDNREAYYSNLPAGTYTFKVRITNNDKSKVENESDIKIIVRPAPWLSWYAKLLYLIIIILILTAVYRVWNKNREAKLKVKLAEQKQKQEQHINEMNMNFFANVSHEFRTPLTMISGSIEQLENSESLSDRDRNLLSIVHRSVKRMINLVNQLLDFNKLDNDTLKLQVSQTDIIGAIKNLTDVFVVNAEDKNITFRIYGIEDNFLMWLDEDKFYKMAGNLLSNAMKFTPEGGKVIASFDVITREDAAKLFMLTDKDVDSQYAKITVANTGIDIPVPMREKIFERYYQMSNHDKGRYNWGTGIGLYYARQLAILHHGYMKTDVLPDDEHGAAFIFILPINDVSYSDDERLKRTDKQTDAFPIASAVKIKRDIKETADERQKILVVDDDTEIAHYLSTLLAPYYNVICRFDADSAVKAAYNENPDVILSDVIMPGKDGYQMCREMKNDSQLCHIPVILVTAKATTENQVEGLNCGADAYVTKPFEPSYLLALIQSQLKNRENIRKMLSSNTNTDNLDESSLLPQDNAFMTKLFEVMETELSNSELDVSKITVILGVSRTKFYYKIKGLTGENPGVFFKTYKLNRAAELISDGKYTVSEVSDITGFSTLSHFSKSFKKQFGVSPSEYKK